MIFDLSIVCPGLVPPRRHLAGAVVPFTVLIILPANRRLLAADLAFDSVEAGDLLRRWGRLHAVRTVLGTLAFAILVFCIAVV